MTWICANCGAEHDSNSPPCTECAHEQFAKLEDSATAPEEIDRTNAVNFECAECGRLHQRNNPPCTDCGSMQLQPTHRTVDAYEGLRGDTEGSGRGEPANDVRKITAVKLFAYAYSAIMLLLSFGYLGNIPSSSPFFFIAGAVAAPAARHRIEHQCSIEFSTNAVLTLVGGATLGALVVLILAS